MKLILIAVGSKMPAWVQTGFDEYARRFPRDMPLELIGDPDNLTQILNNLIRNLPQRGSPHELVTH